MLLMLKKILLEDFEYKGEHSAPDKEDNAPLYDVTINGIYPDDIYSSEGARLYGDNRGDSMDNAAISIIKNCKNMPNKKIKIYRAVPDDGYEVKKERDKYGYIINYYNEFGFFPLKNDIVYSIEDKYDDLEYRDMKKKVYNELKNKWNELNNKLKESKYTINSGDWVTIVKDYAIEHGKSNLKKYKILTKTVLAKELYTDGNDIFEWGYYPL